MKLKQADAACKKWWRENPDPRNGNMLQGTLKESVKLHHEIMKIRTKVLGESLETAQSFDTVGLLLCLVGNPDKAM